jgi:diguanylate cyclase (GGDEF)-like protein
MRPRGRQAVSDSFLVLANLTRSLAALALIVVLLGLLGAVVLEPSEVLPAEAVIAPAYALALLLLAPAVWLSTVYEPVLRQRLALAAMAFAGLALLGWAITLLAGTPRVLAAAGPDGFVAKLLALRPSALSALAIAALGGALYFRDPDRAHFDVSALLATLASALFFLIGLGHLFGAQALTLGPDALVTPSSALAIALLFVLSLAVLAGHPGGPLAVYEGEGPGPVAKRRLLPAAVLTPIATGFLIVYAVDGQGFSPTLAVALAVFANVLVMLLLIHRAGDKVEQLAQDRQARVEARAAQVRKQGLRDPMTNVLNRRGWDTEVQVAERTCRSENANACVLVIDLDGLKVVNDTHGHAAGDAYIRRAAGALRRAARRGDALARVGGDEFAYLVVGCDEDDARAVVARFEDSLRQSKISASVGYAMRGRRSLVEAFGEADQAMYQRKRAQRRQRA